HQRLLLLTNVGVEKESEKEQQVDAAIVRLDRLEAFLSASEVGRPAATVGGEDASSASRFAPAMTKEDFCSAVGRAKESILSGDAYQIVLSQRWTAALDVDPFDVYRALRMLNPSPYLFYLETREATIFGASPEMLVRCRSGVAETRPIAGTAPRGPTPAEDDA